MGGERPRGVDYFTGAQGGATVATEALRRIRQSVEYAQNPVARGQPGRFLYTERHGVLFNSDDARASPPSSHDDGSRSANRIPLASIGSQSLRGLFLDSGTRETFGRPTS